MRFLLPLLMTAGLLAGGWVAGVAITADPPIIGSTEIAILTSMQNTDAGAVYHSAESRVYGNVAAGVFERGCCRPKLSKANFRRHADSPLTIMSFFSKKRTSTAAMRFPTQYLT